MKKSVCGVIAALAFASTSSAATLIFDGTNILGATGVVVDRISYTVNLTDGTCADVYGTCSKSAFDFSTQARATDAAQALLDQVYLPAVNQAHHGFYFRSIEGCGSSDDCETFIAYDTGSYPANHVNPERDYDNVAMAVLENITPSYVGIGVEAPPFDDTTLFNYENYARFTPDGLPIPEPATWTMVICGLGWVGGAMRRRKIESSFN